MTFDSEYLPKSWTILYLVYVWNNYNKTRVVLHNMLQQCYRTYTSRYLTSVVFINRLFRGCTYGYQIVSMLQD